MPRASTWTSPRPTSPVSRRPRSSQYGYGKGHLGNVNMTVTGYRTFFNNGSLRPRPRGRRLF